MHGFIDSKPFFVRPVQHPAPLRELVAPYILRRSKSDKRTIADLPDKTEVRSFCHLGKLQVSLYEESVSESDGDCFSPCFADADIDLMLTPIAG